MNYPSSPFLELITAASGAQAQLEPGRFCERSQRALRPLLLRCGRHQPAFGHCQSRARLLELAPRSGERSFQLLARGFLCALRQPALEELADAGVQAQPPFSGAGRERLLERRGHATVDDFGRKQILTSQALLARAAHRTMGCTPTRPPVSSPEFV